MGGFMVTVLLTFFCSLLMGISELHILNSPGTTHDSTMATMSRSYNQIDDVFYSMEGTAKVVVELAFAAEDRPSLVKSFSNNVR